MYYERIFLLGGIAIVLLLLSVILRLPASIGKDRGKIDSMDCVIGQVMSSVLIAWVIWALARGY